MARSLALFNSEVRPLLKRNCINCHGGEKIRAGLNLNTREGLLEGGDNGPPPFPAMPRQQPPHRPHRAPRRTLHAQERREDPRRRTDRELRRSGSTAAPPTAKPILNPDEAAADRRWPHDRHRRGSRLLVLPPAFQAPAPPEQYNAGWARNAIDRLHRRKTRSRRPSAKSRSRSPQNSSAASTSTSSASPRRRRKWRSLPRRLRIEDPDSYQYREPLADELLANPHHGEKWARHWLDVARFAESHGFEQDYDRPYAYPLPRLRHQAPSTDDMPYDQLRKVADRRRRVRSAR